MGEDEAENPPYKQSEEKANLEKLLILYVIKSKKNIQEKRVVGVGVGIS